MNPVLPHDILSHIAELLAPLPKDTVIGVAVSGGSDSVALLLALRAALPEAPLRAATVDHGLRIEAKQEAQWVSELCAELGVDHSILRINDLPMGPNLQARARCARYDALAAWGQDMACSCICLGHSQTDVAESFLMRLARGSGIDGLSEMRRRWTDRGMEWLRPLLAFSRTNLQDLLRAQGQGWCNDPSNEDPAFMRVRMRQAAPDLDALGLTGLRLAKTATRMRYVQEALEFSVRELWPQVAKIDFTDVLFDRKALCRLPREYVERMLADALNWISGQPYRPRNAALLRCIAAKKTMTLHGCVLIPQSGNVLRISREFSAVEGLVTQADLPWDSRLSMVNSKKSYEIRALGPSGLGQCPTWRDTGRPRLALLSSPSVWHGPTLLAAPMAQFGQKDVLEVVSPPWE
jgi:tRNA(Ile)-lysidine synthase